MLSVLKIGLAVLALLLLVPIAVAAALHVRHDAWVDWWSADRTSAGLLPSPATHRDAVVRVFAAPTVRWRGIFAVHCWIVVKPEGAAAYTRYDYTAWGAPIRTNGFAPDGRWFGRVPEVVFAADGEAAAAMIPRIQAAVAAYAWAPTMATTAPGRGRTRTPSSPRSWKRCRRPPSPCRRRRSARTSRMTGAGCACCRGAPTCG